MKMNEHAVHANHQCAICLTAYYDPVQINLCKHIFCNPCLQDSSILSGVRKCPLCRKAYSPINLVKLQQLWKQMKSLYPQVIQQRSKTIKNKKLLTLKIGNTTKVIQTQHDNKYEWAIYIKTAEGQKPLSHFATKVQFELHPTFHPNKVVFNLVNSDKAQIKRIGWGTFRIGLKVFWNQTFEEQFAQFSHDLEFIPSVEKQIGCYLNQKNKK